MHLLRVIKVLVILKFPLVDASTNWSIHFYCTNLNMNATERSNFRNRKVWKEFKEKIRTLYHGKDCISLKRLNSGWNLHHCNLNPDMYDDLTEANFKPLNRKTHELIHTLYPWYRDDPEVLNRLKEVLDLMVEVNKRS